MSATGSSLHQCNVSQKPLVYKTQLKDFSLTAGLLSYSGTTENLCTLMYKYEFTYTLMHKLEYICT